MLSALSIIKFRALIIGLALTSLSACTPMKNVQLFHTASEACKEYQGLHVFENDTVAIAYYFWANRGVMGFSVFNKLNVPLYIDWKKSSFILNGQKLNYYSEDISTTTITQSQTQSASMSVRASNTYSYVGPALRDYFKSTLSSSITLGTEYTLGFSQSVSTKDERVTFIPPRSYYTSSKHHLYDTEFFKDWGTDYTKTETINPDRPKSKKKLITYSKQFSKNTSPHVFRNFLTFSTKESIENEFHVDNLFYVNKVESIDYRVFVVSQEVKNGYEHFCPFVKGNRFYLDKNPNYSVIKIHN